MTHNISVDPEALRADVRDKYKDVATNPHGTFHFHTGRPLAALLGYDRGGRCPARPGGRVVRRRRQPPLVPPSRRG